MQNRHHKVWPKGLPHALEPLAASLFQNLENTARARPDTPAIIYYGRVITYAELLAEVRKLAGYLSARAGVGDDDRVVLYLQNSPQFIIGYYAILAANAVVVPVNPMCRAAELQYIAQDAGARVAIAGIENLDQAATVCQSGQIQQVIAAWYGDYVGRENDLPLPDVMACTIYDRAGIGSLTVWRDALDEDHPPPEHTRRPADWAVIPYSSGSTGKPKGCLHSHATTNAVVQAYVAWIEMPAGATVLSTLPFFHVTGMQNSMNATVHSGATMVLMTRWDRDTAAALIERHRVSLWRSITASAIDFFSNPQLERFDISSLKSIGGGGAQMPEAVAHKIKALTGLDYVEAYGLTETMAPTHMNLPDAPRPQCLGIPIFGVESRILDTESGDELGPNAVGEIVTAGPQIFLGYWNNSTATEEAFIELDGKRFLRTGDIGYYDEDGFFYCVDRLKRMINAAGFKVWPAEVEAMLYEHPAIKEACVVAANDERRGETVKAVIVMKDGAARPTDQELGAWCREKMAVYKVPRIFDFVQTLPRTGMGKIRWRDL